MEELKVSMESPQSGWMSLRLLAGGRQFVAVVGHAPYDSLRDLARALTAMLAGREPAAVRWNAEPEEYDFKFSAEGDGGAGLAVVRYTGHRREEAASRVAFKWRGARRGLCLAFWRELGDLRGRARTDAFEQNWRREFPEREFQELTAALGVEGPAA